MTGGGERPTNRPRKPPKYSTTLGGPHDDRSITPEELRVLSTEEVRCTLRVVAQARAGSVWVGVYLAGPGGADPGLVFSTVHERTPGTPDDRLPEWVAWWFGGAVAGGHVTVAD